MKKISFLLAFLLFTVVNSFAGNKNINFADKHNNSEGSIRPNLNIYEVAYFWGFDGPCLQLFRIEESSYIDYSGMSIPSYLVTEMNTSNYIGTTRICPPTGQAYC